MASTEDTTEQRADAILKESICWLAPAVLGKRVTVGWTADASHGHISKITLTFKASGRSPMCIGMKLVDGLGPGLRMWISCSYKSKTIYPVYLSARFGDEYKKIAKKAGITQPLDEVAHMTEFCVALIAPLFYEFDLKSYLDSTDTVERDGVLYYAGHGGAMRARFPPMFAVFPPTSTTTAGFRAGHSDSDSD